MSVENDDFAERWAKRAGVKLPVLRMPWHSDLDVRENHTPRYQYDCGRCKFHWCCGPLCSCELRKARVGAPDGLPDPPRWRQDEVDAALVSKGYAPQFHGEGAQRR